MTFTVEKGVPLTGIKAAKWDVLYTMEVGDSFPLSDALAANTCRCMAQNKARHPNKTFRVLRQADGSYRCWRTK